MPNWKAHLSGVLTGLSRTHPNATLAEICLILRGVLDVEDVVFFDRGGRELAGESPFQAALDAIAEVRVQVARAATRAAVEAAPASRFREGPSVLEAKDILADDRFERFLHEFLRLEQRHEFMWAGYIVRELLPRQGFAPEEAKLVLDRLRSENLVTITKVPNPKNPDFPATGVHLNREHPRIKALLGEAPPAKETASSEVPAREGAGEGG